MGSRIHLLHGFSLGTQVDQDFIPAAKLRTGRPELREIESRIVYSQALTMRDLKLFITI